MPKTPNVLLFIRLKLKELLIEWLTTCGHNIFLSYARYTSYKYYIFNLKYKLIITIIPSMNFILNLYKFITEY